MSLRWTNTIVLLPLLALGLTWLSSAEPTSGGRALAGKYVGAAKCKSCHSSAEGGDPYGAWSKAKHSHAFEGLKTDAAKELGAKVGIAEPAQDDACVACHVTGHGLPEEAFAKGWSRELGVQCETCHGTGEAHIKERFKAAATAEKGQLQVVPAGELVAAPGVEVCVTCHNPKSPSYQPFCYFEARGKISHFDPRKPRTEAEKADYGKCPCGQPCPHAGGCPDGKCNLKPDELSALEKN